MSTTGKECPSVFVDHRFHHQSTLECQHISFDFEDDFDTLCKDSTVLFSAGNSPSCCQDSATCSSSDITSHSPSSGSSVTSSYSTSASLSSTHSNQYLSSFTCSSSYTSGSSSGLSSSTRSSDSLTKSDFLVGGKKIRPTLKCIRNTLNLASIDTMKRYDRLSSSKSDLHLSSTNESSVDEAESLEDKLTGKSLVSRSSHDIVLESRKSILESYSSTENIIPAPAGSDLHELQDGSGKFISGVPGTTPSTFRSFIKTKTSSGIGIMRTKDGSHHHHLHHSSQDDEEAVQLCDSESTTSSIHTKLSSNGSGKFEIKQSGSGGGGGGGGGEPLGTSQAGGGGIHHHHLSSKSFHHHQQPTPGANLVTETVHHLPTHQAIFLSNPCHSTVSCPCGNNTCNASPQTTITSIDSATSKQLAQLYQQQMMSQAQSHESFYSSQQPLTPQSAQLPSTKSRHLRSALIPPILKPNRFVKHSKGNLLFNVKSGHKSKSKQRLTESKEQLSPARNSELVVESLKSDRMVITQPEEDRRRRTIIIEKQNNSFGFTLQTYGIKHCREGEVELITYVDEVAYGGPAFRGGMRPGDVILSINGRDVEKADHRTLVNYINSCEKTMRLVVLFEDCVRKIELNIKYIKLKKALQQKMAQLEILNQRENQILLNAALRVRSQEDQENQANNNNDITTAVISVGGQLKKYKCKSLDVSLDDINCNNGNNGYCLNTTNCDWPGTQQQQHVLPPVTGEKEYSTTLPRPHVKGQFGGSNFSESEDEEEEYHGQGHEDEERRTLHKGRRKTSTGAATTGKVMEPLQPMRVNSASAANSRSKSLPQSVANSLDCLTNEAYEDDEDLIGSGTTTPRTAESSSKTAVYYDPHSRTPTGTTITTTSGAGNAVTSDKDFITKL